MPDLLLRLLCHRAAPLPAFAITKFLLSNDLPALIGIEVGHRLRRVCSCLAQVFLVHHALLIDDERLDAGNTVLGGIGDVGESARHLAIDRKSTRLNSSHRCISYA